MERQLNLLDVVNYLMPSERGDGVVYDGQNRLQKSEFRVQSEEEQHEEEEHCPNPGAGQPGQGLGIDDECEA